MTTIGGLVGLQSRRVPDREALVMGSRRWTWRELDEQVSTAAGTLDAIGLAQGDRLAIVSTNTPEFIIAYFAGMRVGAVVVPCNARLAPPELAHTLKDSGARFVLSGPHEGALAHAAAASISDIASVKVLALTDVVAAAPTSRVLADRAGEDDNALIVYTSGTTGRPKGVLHTTAPRSGLPSLRSRRWACGTVSGTSTCRRCTTPEAWST
jgi:fatty-acyl-CoA synthase